MKHTTQRGFTLIELLVAILIVGIIFGMGIPTFRELSRNNRVTAGQNDLVTALNLARSEALRRAQPVSVCASRDGAACATGSDWASGWIVFTDGTGGAPGVVDGGDKVLQVWAALSTSVIVTASDYLVRYLPTGESAGPLTLDLTPQGCAAGQKKDRNIQISGSGSLNSKLTNCP